MQSRKLAWLEPLKFAEKISQNHLAQDWVFLYSGLSLEVKNSFSYIAIFPKKKLLSDDFLEAEKFLKNKEEKSFGYLSYELGSQFEKLPKSKKSTINLPKICLINFEIIFKFDHKNKILSVEFEDDKKLEKVLQWKLLAAVKPSKSRLLTNNLDSNFSDKSYLQAISDIKKQISCGDFYQTNLTRKFFGNFDKNLDQKSAFQMFLDLTKLSPANYSSFLQIDQNFVISSSPELFLQIKNNKIISRPIKGTTPRKLDAAQDLKSKNSLKNSPKERAENLMIVDLVRNDLSRVCAPASVVVKKLFFVNSYQNIHHMSSEIHGKIAQNFDNCDVIKACFPPGSMTGAPKIKAMEAVAKKEKIARGIYSGAIGFFSKKETNLSVVIRTLIASGDKFEFQVGGAITFDSDEKSELQEIYAKAKAIFELLKISFFPSRSSKKNHIKKSN